MYFRNYQFKKLNFRLLALVIALTVIGIVLIGSSDQGAQKRQIMGLAAAIVVMAVSALIDYEMLIQYHWLFYGLTVFLLALVIVAGSGSYGAKRWISVGINVQPSEIAKIFLVIFFAWFVTKHEEDLNTPKIILSMMVLAGIPLVLILLEPDLSTTIVTFLVIFTIIFAGGLTHKIVSPILYIGIPLIFVYILFVKRTGNALLPSYQAERVLAWLRPDEFPKKAYQQRNSIMAIGSGMLFGKGLNNSSADSVTSGNFVPVPQSDFIFAVAGEELGFIGCVVIIVLLLFIAIECIRSGLKAKSEAGKILCIGVASIIAYQSFVNICVVTGLMPNTGLTLPFVSYGLTSLLTLYLGIGIVLNVSMQEKRYR